MPGGGLGIDAVLSSRGGNTLVDLAEVREGSWSSPTWVFAERCEKLCFPLICEDGRIDRQRCVALVANGQFSLFYLRLRSNGSCDTMLRKI